MLCHARVDQPCLSYVPLILATKPQEDHSRFCATVKLLMERSPPSFASYDLLNRPIGKQASFSEPPQGGQLSIWEYDQSFEDIAHYMAQQNPDSLLAYRPWRFAYDSVLSQILLSATSMTLIVSTLPRRKSDNTPCQIHGPFILTAFLALWQLSLSQKQLFQLSSALHP